MKKINLAISWFFLFLVLIFYFTYFQSHANNNAIEWASNLYDIWAAQFGISHIPFHMLIRPGFLLNTPLMMLGVSPRWLSYIFMGLVLITAVSFITVLNENIWKEPVFPWLILLVLPMAIRPLDYETAPIIFLVLSLFFYFFRHRGYGLIFPFLSGLCLGYASFSHLGVLPAGFIVSLGMMFFYSDSRARWAGIFSLFFIIFFISAYYGFCGVFERLIHGVSLSPNGGKEDIFKIKLTFGLFLFFPILIGFALAYLLIDCFFMKGVSKDLWRFRILSVCFLGILGVHLFCFLSGEDYIWDGVDLIFVGLSFFLMIERLDRKNNDEFYKRSLFCFLAFWVFLLFNRLSAFTSEILINFYLHWFFPLFALVLLKSKAWVSPKQFVFLFAILLLSLLISWAYFMNLKELVGGFGLTKSKNLVLISSDNKMWLSGGIDTIFENTVPSFTGNNISESFADIIQKLQMAYDQNHCESKPLLILGYPGYYFLFKRLAPFDNSWISEEAIIPDEARITDDFLIHWLATEKSWCVIDVNTMAGRQWESKKHFLVATDAYLLNHANTNEYLGYDWSQGIKTQIWVKE